MKRIALLLSLGILAAAPSPAVELVRWQRVPLTIRLVVEQERVIFIDRNVRVGVPASIGERLRVQTAGGALYLRANAPIEPTRLQLQDAESGALILLDIIAEAPTAAHEPLEPVRIIYDDATTAYDTDREHGLSADKGFRVSARTVRATPVPVVLTRYAAQSLYAPLRTLEPALGVAQVAVRGDLALDTLLPSVPIQAKALAAWRLDDHWVTAIKLTNASSEWIELDPRALQGRILTATFQHPDLGPAGKSTDTTVVYLVTRGHALADALLPAIGAVDASLNLPTSGTGEGAVHEE